MRILEHQPRSAQSRIDMIVCSSAARWRAAVRTAIRESLGRWPGVVIRLHEVDELAQATQTLESSPGAVLGLEVGEENLRPCVEWLKNEQRVAAPVVGLLTAPPSPIESYSHEDYRVRLTVLHTLIREAGAVWTLDSPLAIMELIQIAVHCCGASPPPSMQTHPLTEKIWRMLPWQSTRSPLWLREKA